MPEVLKDQEVTKNDSGTISHGGVEYIAKQSYDVVASKAKTANEVLEKIEADKKKADEAELAKKGEQDKVIAAKEAEIEALKTSQVLKDKQTALKLKASQEGAANVDTFLKLADLEKVELDAEGNVKAESVDALITSMKTSDPYLFTTKTAENAGAGTKGAGEGGEGSGATKQFFRSQLSDSKFYQENRTDILAAQAAGTIVDDIS